MERRRRSSPQTTSVLLALADEGNDWSHGYDLCGRLGLQAGTVYPILMRLADRGQVETAWEREPPRGRPARHLYRLSASGAELAASLRVAAVSAGRITSKDASKDPSKDAVRRPVATPQVAPGTAGP